MSVGPSRGQAGAGSGKSRSLVCGQTGASEADWPAEGAYGYSLETRRGGLWSGSQVLHCLEGSAVL